MADTSGTNIPTLSRTGTPSQGSQGQSQRPPSPNSKQQLPPLDLTSQQQPPPPQGSPQPPHGSHSPSPLEYPQPIPAPSGYYPPPPQGYTQRPYSPHPPSGYPQPVPVSGGYYPPPPQGYAQPPYDPHPPSPSGYSQPVPTPSGYYPPPPQGYAQPPYSPHPSGYSQPVPSPGGYYPPPPQGYAQLQYPTHPPLPSGYSSQPVLPPSGPYPPQSPLPRGYALSPPGQPNYLQHDTYPPPHDYPSGPQWYQPQANPLSGQPPSTPSRPTSTGYIPGKCADASTYNPKQDSDVIRKSLAPIIIDSDPLVRVLPYLTPEKLESISTHLAREHHVSLSELVDKKVGPSSSFRELSRAILLGPLGFDVWLLNRAMEGVGTKEKYLDLILLGRKNGDVEVIKDTYRRRYRRSLPEDIRKELSGDVQALFMNALEARRADEDHVGDVDSDVKELYAAMVGKAEGRKIAEILVTRSDAHLVAVVDGYAKTYQGKTLEEVIRKKLKGHMEGALLYIIRGVKGRAVRDAKLLEGTMKGLGTKDEELNYRIAILHWDKAHLRAVKEAYKLEFPKKGGLVARVKTETSGDHERLLVALLED